MSKGICVIHILHIFVYYINEAHKFYSLYRISLKSLLLQGIRNKNLDWKHKGDYAASFLRLDGVCSTRHSQLYIAALRCNLDTGRSREIEIVALGLFQRITAAESCRERLVIPMLRFKSKQFRHVCDRIRSGKRRSTSRSRQMSVCLTKAMYN